LVKLVYPLLKRPLPTLAKVVDKYGSMVEFNGGKYQQLFLVSDPEAVKYILKTNKDNFKRSPVIKALKPLLGDGIFISEGTTWKDQRQALKPAFHDSVIAQFEAVILEETQLLIETWSNRPHPIDIEEDIELLMLKILIKTQFCSSVKLDVEEIQRAHLEVLEKTSIRNQKVGFYVNKLRKSVGLSSKKKRTNTAVAYLDVVAKKIITHGQNHMEECSYWLRAMLEANVNENEIRDQILNFIFAGYDTTASALSWALYSLSTHNNEQTKCRKEGSIVPVEFKNIGQLKYTKNCIQESLRLYPPVWSIHRQSTEPDTIADHDFKAQSYFMICLYTMHRDKNVWEHPDVFDPNRFNGDGLRGKAFQYLPFGQGERVCIGQSLAILEMQLIIGKLLQAFEFDYNESKPPEIVPGIIMKSKAGIWLNVKLISD
jgi:cytochrome P450